MSNQLSPALHCLSTYSVHSPDATTPTIRSRTHRGKCRFQSFIDRRFYRSPRAFGLLLGLGIVEVNRRLVRVTDIEDLECAAVSQWRRDSVIDGG